MTTFPLMQVDAFTDRPLAGNPCAVVFEADDLDDKAMLAIAREMNLSETAFVSHSQNYDVDVRFFTPAEEIPLAGHPTIATVQALLDDSQLVLEEDQTTITLGLIEGPISVDIWRRRGQRPLIVMAQRQPEFLNTYDIEQATAAFGLRAADVLPGYPVQTVSTGTPQLMIPLCDLEALRKARVDGQVYQRLRDRGDFFSPHLFCLQGLTEQGQTFARHFGIPPDSPEDPFTGSATGGMAAYLWHYGLLEEPRFIAEQGHWMGRPGQAEVQIIGTREKIQRVFVGGTAVTIMRGQLML